MENSSTCTEKNSKAHNMDRRRFLQLAGVCATGLFFPVATQAGIRQLEQTSKTLSFYNTHTDESLQVTYSVAGHYLPDVLLEINHILRDHRTGEIRSMDPALLDILHSLTLKTSKSEPIHIVSGYRSPKTNALLRKKSPGVAKNSLHLAGKAIDIRIPGVDTNILQRAAKSLCAGGVGYYPRSNFIHVDTGRVRYW